MTKLWSQIVFFSSFLVVTAGLFCFILFNVIQNVQPQVVAFFIYLLPVLFLTVFFLLKRIGHRKIKQIYDHLFQQINLLCENQNSRDEFLYLLKKTQQLTNTTPELTLKILRRYLSMPLSKMPNALFSPAQQVAIVLTCLDSRAIKKLFKRFTSQEIVILNQLTSCLGDVSTEDKKNALSDFLNEVTAPALNPFDNYPLQAALPHQQVIQFLKDENLPMQQKDIWKTLNQLSTERIITYLKTQSSQSIAIILYNLSEEKSANILNLLPEKISSLALLRLTALKSLSRTRVKTIETKLENHFFNIQPQIFYDGWQKASAILSLMSRYERKKLISALEHKSQKSAYILSRQIVCFDDFAYWDDADICYLIKKTPEHILTKALLGANSNTRAVFSKNMSPKQWGNLLKIIDSSQVKKIKEIDQAQFFILKKARILIDKKYKRKK